MHLWSLVWQAFESLSPWESPSKANSFSSGKVILRLLWNSKFHYRVHKSPSLVPVLFQINPAHICTACFFTISFNVTAQSTPVCPKLPQPCKFRDLNFMCLSLFAMPATCPVHCALPGNLIVFNGDLKCWSHSLWIFLQHAVDIFSVREYFQKFLLNAAVCSCHRLRYQVSHPCKMKCKFLFLHFQIGNERVRYSESNFVRFLKSCSS
jgi:hypothetical protein